VTVESGHPGTRVTVVDLLTGDTESRVIQDDYNIVCDGAAYVAHVQVHSNGTHVITVKRVAR
jgi:hypothetical protein